MARRLDPHETTTAEALAPPHILLVEDDAEAARGVRDALEATGWRVDLAADGEAGLRRGLGRLHDVIVLDRLLPGLDGLEVLARLREAEVDAPVLLLTALGSVADRVEGLEAGGDDYLVKPYAVSELRARVQALARRSVRGAPERTRLSAGGLVLDRVARRVTRGGETVELLPLEFRLLDVLMRNAGRVVTRAMLLEQVWGFRFDPRTNIVETHLSRLRRKLDAPGAASPISTVRGAGYVLADG